VRSRVVRAALACAIAAAITFAYAAGGLRLVDNAVHELRMRSIDLPASGGLVIVEIDPSSLHRLGQWPWPRGHHAQVLDRLIAAGAARVAFDVSFSSPSDPAQDARLAEAAARAGDRLVLPVFQQRHRDAAGDTTTLIDRPLPQLFPDAALASINVRPDADGIVRRLASVDDIAGTAVPFLVTALLPAPPEAADAPYVIDFGIDVASVPRLSFADVLLGRFDPAVVAGRSVLIGATAVELGDVLAVPRWGNLPGALAMATGFETQVQGRATQPLDAPWFVFVLCLAAAMAPAACRSRRLASALLPAAIQVVGLAAIGEVLYVEWALVLDLAPVGLALLVGYVIEIGRGLRAQARRIAVQNRDAERRQALLRSVVATSIDAVVITDRRGEIRLANPACRTVFGHDPEALIGRAAEGLLSPSDRLAPQLRAMARGGGVPALRYPVDIEGLHATGAPLELELALAEVATEDAGGPDDQHTIYVFRDVSAQRQLEASRRLALEARLEAERAKSDFLSTASHELRTPLNHIKGFASLLAAGVGGGLSPKQTGYVADIDAAAGHLFELVTDILAYAEEGAPVQDSEPSARRMAAVAVGDLLAAAQAMVARLAAERGIRIELTGDGLAAWLSVDQPAMVRALMHVLRNAVQFSPADGVVAVTARALPSRPGGEAWVEIVIADQGPGMTPRQIEHVLTAFGQVEGALARTHGGLGVGLSLARGCVERHGGRLSMASTPGQGTAVTFALPLAAAGAAAA
jgi:PAS domain S-box-containing protein